jgi:hypothetical protein
MGTDISSILEGCGILTATFGLVGFCALLIAVRKARPEFRQKGFLRTPSGKRWFRFLLWKQYAAFDDPGTRFFFGVSHLCMLGIFFALGSILVLLGSTMLLDGVDNFPSNGTMK